jgi:hypothetical protein
MILNIAVCRKPKININHRIGNKILALCLRY